MFDDIGEIRSTRKKYNQAMFRSGIATFRKFEDLALNGGPADWPIRFFFKVLEEVESSKERER